MRKRGPTWWHRLLWPRGPLAAFMLLAGIVNLVAGARSRELAGLLPGLQALSTTGFTGEVSFRALGAGVQLVLGAGLILTGLGLVGRYRIAWTFALLLLLLTIGVDLTRGGPHPAMIVPAAALIALVSARRYFARRTLFGSTLVALLGIAVVLAYGTFGCLLLGGEFSPRVASLVPALYFTVVTLSTVGYGDIHPVTATGQLFVISLVLGGLGVFATAVISVLGPVLSRELDRFFVPRGGPMNPRDHVILVMGKSRVAWNTAHELVRRGIAVVQVVAPDQEPPLPDKPVVRGAVSDDATLNQAGIATARMVIAAADDDGENAFVSLTAKDLNPNAQVLAVASSPRAIRRLKLARADVVFVPAAVGGRLLADLVEGTEIPKEFLDLLKGDTA